MAFEQPRNKSKRFRLDIDINESKRHLIAKIFPAIQEDQNSKSYLAARVLIANALHANNAKHRTMAIPQTNGAIKPSTPNNHFKITNYFLKPLLRYMEKHQFFQKIPGYHDKLSKKGRVTRYTLTDEFDNFITIIGFKPFDYEPIKNGDLLILKDRNKKIISYEDNLDTIRIKGNLQAFNKIIQNSTIKIDNNFLGKDQFYRVFNDGCFTLGGRFYSLKLTNFPKKQRKYLKANDTNLIELDFKEMQPSLLYNKNQQTFKGDVYSLKGINTKSISEKTKRKIAKKCFLIMLNCSSEDGAHRSLINYLTKNNLAPNGTNRAVLAKTIIDEMMKNHGMIKDHFFKGKTTGLELTFIESQIAERIILHFAENSQIIIPIHDSFLVTSQNKDMLEKIMTQAYHQIIEGHFGRVVMPPKIVEK